LSFIVKRDRVDRIPGDSCLEQQLCDGIGRGVRHSSRCRPDERTQDFASLVQEDRLYQGAADIHADHELRVHARRAPLVARSFQRLHERLQPGDHLFAEPGGQVAFHEENREPVRQTPSQSFDRQVVAVAELQDRNDECRELPGGHFVRDEIRE
jgi:hypothetical protein